jgi:hypothetical protein
VGAAIASSHKAGQQGEAAIVGPNLGGSLLEDGCDELERRRGAVVKHTPVTFLSQIPSDEEDRGVETLSERLWYVLPCRHPPPKQAGVMLRWGGDGSHGREQAGPDLPGVDTGAQQVVACLIHMVVEGAGRVGLKAMPLSTLGGTVEKCFS